MHHLPNIQFLTNKAIDKQKWDNCIINAANGLIYAKAFYLDNIAAGWNALAGEDYEWVLPLPNKKKYGIPYLYQPPFTQQLGIFSQSGIIVPYQQIIQYLQQRYPFWDISWNFATPPIFTNSPAQISATNFVLHLSGKYETIATNYHQDLIKNLKKSKQFHHRYRVTNDFHSCIQLYRKYYGKRIPHVKEQDYKNFAKICLLAQENNMIVCREAVNYHGTVMATVLLLFDGKRLYNLMNTTTEAGRKTAANHFLLNAVIEEYAGSDMILDFEGSDLPGVKTFYQNFGAINQPYFRIKHNHLPWPLHLLKK